MPVGDFDWNVEYWTEKLQEVDKGLEPFKKALFEIPTPEMTIEERYRLRELLMTQSSYVSLLARDLEVHKNEPKKSLWKRIRNQ